MRPFSYSRATTVATALAQNAEAKKRYLGAGTNLVDLMRRGVEMPEALIDVTGLSQDIVKTQTGGLLIGGAATNTALAENSEVRARYPALSRAILAGASQQIRNMATVAGNVMQRTRCTYFYDAPGARCNKRVPGQGCDAIDGFNRYAAIFGTSSHCIAAHPSDMAVALVAFDALLWLEGPAGSRKLALADLYSLPGETPQTEFTLQEGELVTHIELPALSATVQSTYRKVRDRASYAFALVSVAGGLDLVNGRINDIRLALGGVGPKPWRATKAERALAGERPSSELFVRAAQAELAGARTFSGNAFKPELAKRTIVAVLEELVGEKT